MSRLLFKWLSFTRCLRTPCIINSAIFGRMHFPRHQQQAWFFFVPFGKFAPKALLSTSVTLAFRFCVSLQCRREYPCATVGSCEDSGRRKAARLTPFILDTCHRLLFEFFWSLRTAKDVILLPLRRLRLKPTSLKIPMDLLLAQNHLWI